MSAKYFILHRNQSFIWFATLSRNEINKKSHVCLKRAHPMLLAWSPTAYFQESTSSATGMMTHCVFSRKHIQCYWYDDPLRIFKRAHPMLLAWWPTAYFQESTSNATGMMTHCVFSRKQIQCYWHDDPLRIFKKAHPLLLAWWPTAYFQESTSNATGMMTHYVFSVF